MSDATINDFVSKMGSLESIWGLCGKDISELDFSKASEELFIINPGKIIVEVSHV
ncbi:MAG: hypothetical protein FWD23_14635 [Oscillospiraceae bacterium]|nr:hypothetical protein [Oscillospiraceae bacterium]